jgi:hypothetical protein
VHPILILLVASSGIVCGTEFMCNSNSRAEKTNRKLVIYKEIANIPAEQLQKGK